MNTIETITLLAVIGTLIFLAAPHVRQRLVEHTNVPPNARPVTPGSQSHDMTFIRHNSGTAHPRL